MEIKGWHRRFLGNTSSAIWHVDRRMGKDFITVLDLVKYQRPVVVLPDESFRVFQARCTLLYSTIKNMQIELVPASHLDDLTLADAYKTADALYFLEYSLYPKEIRKFILESAKDIEFSYSLLKIRAQNLFPVHIVGSHNEEELKTLSELLNMPVNRVLKDY
jgi:hypothetical protein